VIPAKYPQIMTSEESSNNVPIDCTTDTKTDASGETTDLDIKSTVTQVGEPVVPNLPNGESACANVATVDSKGSDALETDGDSCAGAKCVAGTSHMDQLESDGATEADSELVNFKVGYNKQSFNVSFPIDSMVLSLKEHIQELTDVEVKNQKIMFKGLMKDEMTLRDHKLTNGSKVMIVGSKTTDIQSVNQSTSKSAKDADKSSTTSTKEPLCKQKPHKAVLDKYGKPDDAMPGVKSRKDALPPVPLSGMYNKLGSKVRLTFKLESDQVWIGTKERTEKVGLTSIKAIVSEPIEGHEEYHMLGIQLGPTEASRYWIYWVPAQYVDSIKDAVLGNWQYF
jgi:hypothetical protein